MISTNFGFRSIACTLLLLLCGVHFTSTLIVPQELPSILSLIYSNVPQIKKGTDSRLGFGFRLGEHADFQVVVELGPQKETKPLGDPESDDNSFSKRQVSKAQELEVMRQQLRAAEKLNASKKLERISVTKSPSQTSWLESWSKDMTAQKPSSLLTRPTAKSQPVIKKKPVDQTSSFPSSTVPTMPTMPQLAPQSLLQLQLLYKMASGAESTVDSMKLPETLFTTVRPKSLSNLSLTQLNSEVPSQYLGAEFSKKTKSQITAELMDVNLDNER